jgi:hypothetical protein
MEILAVRNPRMEMTAQWVASEQDREDRQPDIWDD